MYAYIAIDSSGTTQQPTPNKQMNKQNRQCAYSTLSQYRESPYIFRKQCVWICAIEGGGKNGSESESNNARRNIQIAMQHRYILAVARISKVYIVFHFTLSYQRPMKFFFSLVRPARSPTLPPLSRARVFLCDAICPVCHERIYKFSKTPFKLPP